MTSHRSSTIGLGGLIVGIGVVLFGPPVQADWWPNCHRDDGCGELYLNDQPQYSGIQRSLQAGDHFLCRIPGGGGLGDPKKRDPDRVQRDLDYGLISSEFARTHHGRPDAGDD